MKTIKIFLASSEELDYDRMVFGNLVRRLDDVYEKRGLRIKLFEWEDYDAAFNDRRKQDEYNDKVKDSDIFLALFYKKAGQFTVEEFDVASAEFRQHASPKVYTYLRDLQPGEKESPELAEFKKRLFDEMGHYWCRYDNRDSLQLQFVMQLQLVESTLSDSIKVEDGEVSVEGMKVATMDHLRFAAGNEDYVKMSEEIAALPAKIEKARLRLEKYPDDEDLAEDLAAKQDKYNKLKEEFSEHQKLLFNTAKRVAQLQGERVNGRIRRAMDALNEGKVREANIILDEAEEDARRNLEGYKQSREITEQKRQTVICSIQELLLKTATVMAEASIPIEVRVEKTDRLYAQTIEMAKEVGYDNEKLARIEEDYKDFLILHVGHLFNAGEAAYKRGDYAEAIAWAMKGIASTEKNLGESFQGMDSFYNLLGRCYFKTGDYGKALEAYNKALALCGEIYAPGHECFLKAHNAIGLVYLEQEDYGKALACFEKALTALDSPRIKSNKRVYLTYGNIYGNIGLTYKGLGNKEEARDYLSKAATIFSKILGPEHAKTHDVNNQLRSL